MIEAGCPLSVMCRQQVSEQVSSLTCWRIRLSSRGSTWQTAASLPLKLREARHLVQSRLLLVGRCSGSLVKSNVNVKREFCVRLENGLCARACVLACVCVCVCVPPPTSAAERRLRVIRRRSTQSSFIPLQVNPSTVCGAALPSRTVGKTATAGSLTVNKSVLTAEGSQTNVNIWNC